MPRRKDITGHVFGRLTVLAFDHIKIHRYLWRCRCSCGNIAIVNTSDLRTGNTQSCGCLQAENRTKATRTHGMRQSCEYHTWLDMNARCSNSRRTDFHNYGGRGIHVCARWRDFAAFYADMGPRPSPQHTIDRIDNDGPYAPDNCRWATRQEQIVNKRNNHRVTFQGRTLTISQWAAELDLRFSTLLGRFRSGWSTERALTTPLRSRFRQS